MGVEGDFPLACAARPPLLGGRRRECSLSLRGPSTLAGGRRRECSLSLRGPSTLAGGRRRGVSSACRGACRRPPSTGWTKSCCCRPPSAGWTINYWLPSTQAVLGGRIEERLLATTPTCTELSTCLQGRGLCDSYKPIYPVHSGGCRDIIYLSVHLQDFDLLIET